MNHCTQTAISRCAIFGTRVSTLTLQIDISLYVYIYIYVKYFYLSLYYTYPHDFTLRWLALAFHWLDPNRSALFIYFLYTLDLVFFYLSSNLFFLISLFIRVSSFFFFFCVCLCGWMFACNAHSAYVSFNVGSFFVVSFLFPSFCSSLSISFPPLSSATRLLLCYFFFFSSYSLLRLQLSKCRNLTEECVAVKVKTKMENDRTKEIKKKNGSLLFWVYYSCIF